MSPELQQLYRAKFGELVAATIRIAGDLSCAEDLIQDAFLKAAQQWPEGELPPQAAGWIFTSAKHAAVDQHRRQQAWDERAPAVAYLQDIEQNSMDTVGEGPVVQDDLLRLIFTCCHPALSIEARVALCLHTVCGLQTEEIARAFIVTQATMSQRLWRAKTKIRDAGIGYKVPSADELQPRLDSVLAVIYLIFNEGWLATQGDEGQRVDLANEAIRLARLLSTMVPAEFDVLALLGLMVLQHSRRDARFDSAGQLVLLADQNRQLWKPDEIREGLTLAHHVFASGKGNTRYAILAAIASVHASASEAARTDWQEIVTLYEHLISHDASPVVALNYAVAVGEFRGPEAGLAQVDELADLPAMQRYYLFHSARADMLKRLGQIVSARQAYTQALELASNRVERRFLQNQLNSLG